MNDQNNESAAGTNDEANGVENTEAQATDTTAGTDAPEAAPTEAAPQEAPDTTASSEPEAAQSESQPATNEAYTNEATTQPEGEPAVETAAATSVPVTPAPEQVTVKFTGAATGEVKVKKGSTASQALKAAGLNDNLMMRSANNDVIGGTKKIEADMTITTVTPARGG